MSEPTIFILDKWPWEKAFTIRLCIPGIDLPKTENETPAAVWLEFVCQENQSLGDVEGLLGRILKALPNVKIETLA